MITKCEWPMKTLDDFKDEHYGDTKRTLFGYFGAKWYFLKVIYALSMVAHDLFFDGCGGSGVVTINNRISARRVLNEVDPEIFNLYRVIQSDWWRDLQWLLAGAAVSRGHYWLQRKNLGLGHIVKQAATFFDVADQCYGGNIKGSGWSNVIGKRSENSRYRKIANLNFFHDRLRDVVLTKMDVWDLLLANDNPANLFYLDPPYVPESRSGGEYRYDMTPEQHNLLIQALINGTSKYIISGYNSPRYNDILQPPKWNKLEIPTKLHIARVNGAAGQHKQARTECFWYNFELPAEAVEIITEIKRKAEARSIRDN